MPSQWTEFTIYQGADINVFFTLKDVNSGLNLNVTSSTITSNGRYSYLDQNTEFSATISIIDGPNGNISWNMTSANSANINPGNYEFDIKVKLPSNLVQVPNYGIVECLSSFS